MPWPDLTDLLQKAAGKQQNRRFRLQSRKCSLLYRGCHPGWDRYSRYQAQPCKAFVRMYFYTRRPANSRASGARDQRMFFLTASATTSATLGSNASGMILFSFKSSSETRAAMALAAASFILSVICFACPSRAPRKMPGNATTLFTWFGKSLRPVPTTRAPAFLRDQA